MQWSRPKFMTQDVGIRSVSDLLLHKPCYAMAGGLLHAQQVAYAPVMQITGLL